MKQMGWPYWLGLMGCAAHFAWQIKTVDLDSPESCMAKFKSNTTVGALLFAGGLISRLL